MGEHAGYDVVVPSWKLTHLVVVHAQFCLGFLKGSCSGGSSGFVEFMFGFG
jgi:hypothetical protein